MLPVTALPLGSVTGTATGATVVTSCVTGFPLLSRIYTLLLSNKINRWNVMLMLFSSSFLLYIIQCIRSIFPLWKIAFKHFKP